MNIRMARSLVPCALSMVLFGCAEADDAADDVGVDAGSTDAGADEDAETDAAGDDDESEGGGPTDDRGDESTGDEAGTEDGTTEDEGTEEAGPDATGTEDDGTEDTGGPALDDDGDSAVAPAVLAQFRATAGGPVSIDMPLFNDEPIDTRGVQYVGAIAADDDPTDHLRFSIVPGETDPYVRVTMECDDPLVRVRILRDDEELGAVLCGDDTTMVLLDGASSLDAFDVVVHGEDERMQVVDYVLSLDAFCFGGCDYQPYMP